MTREEHEALTRLIASARPEQVGDLIMLQHVIDRKNLDERLAFRLIRAAEPFVTFNCSEEEIKILVKTADVTALRAALADMRAALSR